MSRVNRHDNSETFSLFPFLAVLLCTMGALVVVLVSVSHMARGKVAQQVAAKQAEENPHDKKHNDAMRLKLREANQTIDRLDEIRNKAAKNLREDHLRLSHIEDHMRRLQNQLASLQNAQAEIDGLEEEHYDDRDQAEREVARLQQLIEGTRETLKELAAKPVSRSYAIVPFKGANGTRRRPIYIECRKEEVLLQPEGVKLTPDDFLPPLGPGNPLASALRAAREYLVLNNRAGNSEGKVQGDSADAEPYPLILVRPDGIFAYYQVRKAIQSWDSDFGYEMIDGDWELKFPLPDPQLASLEYRAVEQARARGRMLAAAAPRAYQTQRSAAGNFEFGDNFQQGDGGQGGMAGEFQADGDQENGSQFLASQGEGKEAGEGESTGGSGSSGEGGLANEDVKKSWELLTETAQEGTALGNGDGPGEERSEGEPSLAGEPGSQAASPPGSSSDSTENQVAGGAPGMASTSDAMEGGAATPSISNAQATQAAGGSPGAVSLELQAKPPSGSKSLAGTRGKNWALRNGGGRAVPIRRTIRAVVHQDRLAILPDGKHAVEPISGDRVISISGRTEGAMDNIASAFRKHMDDWGIAGQGLTWRPVLVLQAGPGGAQRVDDLTRLLHNSGIEVRTKPKNTATRSEGENSNATR